MPPSKIPSPIWNHRWYILLVIFVTLWYGQSDEAKGRSWFDIFLNTDYEFYTDSIKFYQAFLYYPILLLLTFVNFNRLGFGYGVASAVLLFLVLYVPKAL